MFSKYNLNWYISGVFLTHALTGLYTFYKYHNNIPINKIFESKYAKSYLDLTQLILSSLIVFSLLFAFINVNYTLYSPDEKNTTT